VGSRIRSFLTQLLARLALVRFKGKVYPCARVPFPPPPPNRPPFTYGRKQMIVTHPSCMAVSEQDGQVDALCILKTSFSIGVFHLDLVADRQRSEAQNT